MSKIGIIIAMNKEFDSLSALVGEPLLKEQFAGIDFSSYSINNHTVILARCGIGEIYASTAATLLIYLYGAEELLNYGFVGALSDKYKIFDILAVKDVVHYDMDLTAFGNKPGQYDDRDDELWQADEALTSRIIGSRTITAERIASADKFVRLTEAKLTIGKMFSAEMCDMESAGIAIIANRSKIPFASLKLIVDGVDGDSHAAFEVNAKKGASALAEILFDYLSLV
ncbi:MAG: 5'-methylthioadenosine/S-adenosylhomocysteine nucleosidase [Clostridia bacterium]|nr:5'-methylthioadenosine/S-adenosylhomocysteine nucleosidase [Clostridia bacterium]